MPKIRGSYSKVTFQGARGLAIRQRSHGRTFTHCLSSRVSSNRHAASQEVSACRKTVRSNTEPWPKFPFEILTQTGSIPVHGFAHLGSKANSGHLTPSCYTHKPAIPRLWWQALMTLQLSHCEVPNSETCNLEGRISVRVLDQYIVHQSGHSLQILTIFIRNLKHQKVLQSFILAFYVIFFDEVPSLVSRFQTTLSYCYALQAERKVLGGYDI